MRLRHLPFDVKVESKDAENPFSKQAASTTRKGGDLDFQPTAEKTTALASGHFLVTPVSGIP
jgi:hypothetical protein